MSKFLAGVAVGLIPYVVYQGTYRYLMHVYDRNGEKRDAIQKLIEEL